MLTAGSLFSGIGGLELGLEMSGLVSAIAWQVEKDPFCLSVLARHWPEAKRYGNIEHVRGADLAPVDLVCGGFPCQDVSAAGRKSGLSGSRSGLWFHFARVLSELRELPPLVVVENVASGAGRWVDAVRGDLERLGYESLPIPISAANVGAPHKRARIFVVAYAHNQGQFREQGPRNERGRRPGHGLAPQGLRPSFRPELLRGFSRLPNRLDRIKALGNAVVPQNAEVIGRFIMRSILA